MLKLSKTIEYALMSINHINQCDKDEPIPLQEKAKRKTTI